MPAPIYNQPSPIPPHLKRGLAWGAALLALALAAGCARHTASGSTYTYQQAQREQVVRQGTVLSVRAVTLVQDSSRHLGTIAGAALGGVAGNAVGRGAGRNIATVGGGILGSLLGEVVEHELNRTSGQEITVQLDSGETRVIAQQADIALSAGQRVGVISGHGLTRVVPLQ